MWTALTWTACLPVLPGAMVYQASFKKSTSLSGSCSIFAFMCPFCASCTEKKKKKIERLFDERFICCQKGGREREERKEVGLFS